jgi:hypothetical protein
MSELAELRTCHAYLIKDDQQISERELKRPAWYLKEDALLYISRRGAELSSGNFGKTTGRMTDKKS